MLVKHGNYISINDNAKQVEMKLYEIILYSNKVDIEKIQNALSINIFNMKNVDKTKLNILNIAYSPLAPLYFKLMDAIMELIKPSTQTENADLISFQNYYGIYDKCTLQQTLSAFLHQYISHYKELRRNKYLKINQ